MRQERKKNEKRFSICVLLSNKHGRSALTVVIITQGTEGNKVINDCLYIASTVCGPYDAHRFQHCRYTAV